VATPGRLISLLNSGQVDFKHLQHLILDEADRMLDMGFYNDIMRIVGYLPEKRQALLFSATMPSKIRQLASKILNNPKHINIAISKPAEGIDQQAYIVHDDQKVELTARILSDTNYQTVVIFAGRKESVRQLEKELQRKKMSVKGFQSDLEQSEREEIMLAFKNKQLRILVATDIISRGIDVDGIDLVMNYDVPPDPEDYIHRIGRTARAETTGTAITFVGPRDQRRFKSIEDFLEREIPKKDLPEGFKPGPEYDPSKRSEGSGFSRNKGKSGGGKRFGKPRSGGNRNDAEGSGQTKKRFDKNRSGSRSKPSGGSENSPKSN
jgi:superfamily II DNA/RNA helicase